MRDILSKSPERPVVAVSTLDAKGRETAYLARRIREGGLEVLVVDCGVLGEPLGITPDISHRRVAEAAGTSLEAVRVIGTRGAAVEIMARGLSRPVVEVPAHINDPRFADTVLGLFGSLMLEPAGHSRDA